MLPDMTDVSRNQMTIIAIKKTLDVVKKLISATSYQQC